MDEKLNKKALKSGSGYAVSNILMRSVSIFTAPIFTRLLSPSDYGMVSNFTAWQNIAMIFTGLGLAYSIGPAKLDFSEKFKAFLSSIQTLGALIAYICCILAFIFQKQLALLMGIDVKLVALMFIYLIFYPSVDYIQIKYRYNFKYKENILISLLNTFGTVAFSLLFIWIFQRERYWGRIIGIIFTSFMMGIYYFFKILHEGKCFINLEYWKYALRICIPMIPHSIAMVALNQIDRIQIAKYCGTEKVGLYSFGYTFAILSSLVLNAVGQAWAPWQYEQHNKGNTSEIRKASKFLTFFVCMLTLLLLTLGPEMIMILGSKEYWEAKWVVAPVALGILFQYYYSLYVNVEIYYRKTVAIGICSIIASGINYTLNMLLIPRFGYLAAAYTTLAGYFILMLMHFIMYKKVCKDRLFSSAYMFLSAFATVFFGLFITALYEKYMLRYLIFIAMVLCFIKKYWKLAIQFIRQNM